MTSPRTLSKTWCSPFAVIAGCAVLLCGCYLSHPLPNDASIDAERSDVPRRDVPRRDVPLPDVQTPDSGPRLDAAEPDAGPIECDGIRLVAQALLENDAQNVTPRLVALPGSEVGVVFVSSDGSPRLHYERLSASLERLTGNVILATSFTWAQPARIGDTLYLAYGNAGASRSVLHPFDFQGRSLGRPAPVDLMHPIVLSPAATGFFWLAFEGSPNTLRSVHINDAGVFAHEPQGIDTGRYGSSSRAIPRPGGGSHILAYTREASPGVRDGFVNAIDTEGRLGPERRLSMDRDVSVAPVIAGGELLLVRHNEDRLIVERTNVDTLENVERRPFPPVATRPLATQLTGRLLVAHFEGAWVHVDDFGRDITEPVRTSVPLPGDWSGGADVIDLGDAVVLVGDVSPNPRTRVPWVVRFECFP